MFRLIYLTTLLIASPLLAQQAFTVVDTGQGVCYNTSREIPCPESGGTFFGQDAQSNTNSPSYVDHGNGTVSDLLTGLMWQQTPSNLTWSEAVKRASSQTTGGHVDWRLPTIKELYSLINFGGSNGRSARTSTPYLDTDFFEFEYGDERSGERYIDAQYVSATDYVGTTMGGNDTVFGVNFADGRIKGYPKANPRRGEKKFYVRYVRLAEHQLENHFVEGVEGTVSDKATGLIWSKADSGQGMNWEEALAWVERKNAENHLGFSDWRLPNAKELQGIVDYSRAPDVSDSAAIDPIFEISQLAEGKFPYFWTSTTHKHGPTHKQGSYAVYVTFGRAEGYMEMPRGSGRYRLLDVHGAGSQRSDPKVGDPDDYPYGHGPQGDVIRIFNYVRLVRG